MSIGVVSVVIGGMCIRKTEYDNAANGHNYFKSRWKKFVLRTDDKQEQFTLTFFSSVI